MGFLTSLFGGETNFVTVAIALAIVIILIVLAVWLVKVVGDATRGVGRGRNRRLLIIDSIAIDNKRQAVIIRRDEVEHLIVIGGANDLLIEAGFQAPAMTAQRPRRVPPIEPASPPAPAPHPGPSPVVPGPSRPASKSLRHTGLLRPSADSEPTIDGGNSHKSGLSLADSATSVATTTGLEPVIEPRERKHAEQGTNKS